MSATTAGRIKHLLQSNQAEFEKTLSKIWFKAPWRSDVRPRLGLAISGGVDSMALAYMCSKVRAIEGASPSFTAFIVDHRLRPGSHEETQNVAKNLEALSMYIDHRSSFARM